MRIRELRSRHRWIDVSPWIVLGAAAILAAIVAVLAARNADREGEHMSQILLEKGAALIRAFEAGTRTGLGMRWGGPQLQILLTETAKQPGMLYLAVTDEDGVILAHSDRTRIGERFKDDGAIAGLDQSGGERGRLIERDGQRSFEVYRQFQPLDQGRRFMGGRGWREMWSGQSCPMIACDDKGTPCPDTEAGDAGTIPSAPGAEGKGSMSGTQAKPDEGIKGALEAPSAHGNMAHSPASPPLPREQMVRGHMPRGHMQAERLPGVHPSMELAPPDFPPLFPEGRQFIFVGLDTTHFDEARAVDLRNTVVTAVTLLLLGFGGVLSLFLAQNYRASRRLLQDATAFSSEVVANLPVGLVATDREGRINLLNPAAERLSGTQAVHLVGRAPAEAFPEAWPTLRRALAEAGSRELATECVFPGGRRVPVGVSATRIVNEDGGHVGNAFILRDLAEVRRLEEEVRRGQKLAALGSLAAGVAHEIRNPLSSIKGLATYFGGTFPEGSEDREAAGVMVREVDRLNRVISDLLEFARPSDVKPTVTDLKPLLEHSLRLVGLDATPRGIAVELRIDGVLPRVGLDADRFSQALLNLYLNGIQAMDGSGGTGNATSGGTLTVRAWADGHIDVQKANRPRRVFVEIADTGRGIEPADVQHVFDPYYTTKPSGTGLGLAIVHKIIEAHGGSIVVRSELGRGTTVTITLPCVDMGIVDAVGEAAR